MDVDPQDLRSLVAMLNTTLTDITPDGITPQLMAKLQRNAGSAASLVSVIVEFTVNTLGEEQKKDVYVTGQTKLLGQPEYQDIGKAHEITPIWTRT